MLSRALFGARSCAPIDTLLTLFLADGTSISAKLPLALDAVTRKDVEALLLNVDADAAADAAAAAGAVDDDATAATTPTTTPARSGGGARGPLLGSLGAVVLGFGRRQYRSKEFR